MFFTWNGRKDESEGGKDDHYQGGEGDNLGSPV